MVVALAAGCFSPRYQDKLMCASNGGCPPGQSCDPNSDMCIPTCADGICGPSIHGTVLRADQVAPTPLAGVSVDLVSTSQVVTTTSAAGGTYSLTGLPSDVALEMELSYAQDTPTIPEGELDTTTLAGNASGSTAVDLEVVPYRWLADVAWKCGLFPTEDDAVYGSPGMFNQYFIQRSTVIGEVQDAAGNPVPLDRADITISLDGYANTNDNPADTTFLPAAHICFLEQDATGTWKGVDEDSSATGRFVMFRVRNAAGTGVGFADVSIKGQPDTSANLRSSGLIAIAKVQPGGPVQPIATNPTFERDVYPLLGQYGCVGCHQPGQPGMVTGMVRDGFPADFSGTPGEVYDVLTKPDSTGCASGTPARVCVAMPELSLFYTKPRLETGGTPPDHLGIAFPESTPIIQTILAWIQGGAQP
jgi:hypothetical protein